MTDPRTAPPPTAKRGSPVLIGVGALVIALGFGLPRLLPDAAPAPAAPAPAAPEPPPATPRVGPPPVDGPSVGAALARLAGSSVVVCGLIVVVMKLAGRRSAVRPAGMVVAASLPVDSRCVVYLVEAGPRRLLLGVDAGGVKALVELPGLAPVAVPETPAAVSSPRPAAAAARPAAAAVVVGPFRVAEPAAPPPPSARPTPDEIVALIERLRKVA